MTFLDEYLESLGCELWPGEAFYLTDPKSRADAARWLRQFLVGYHQYVEKQTEYALHG